MKNPATHRPERNKLNIFTAGLKDCFLETGEMSLVKLRNGNIVEVFWFSADADGTKYEGLASNTNGCYRWEHDGTSITSKDFDMMETV